MKNDFPHAPEADRRTLIRRLYFDLIGLPPTPEEIAAFVADHDPASLRASGRSTCSLRRATASAGRGTGWMSPISPRRMATIKIGSANNAWPYRDYLIASFNADKPYGRFVEEQVAGDVLFPDDPQATVALGFLAAGPWDESSLRDIQENTLDRKIARYIDRDDMVSQRDEQLRQHDGAMCPLPRSQVRSDLAARLLRAAGRVRRRRSKRPGLRCRSRGRPRGARDLLAAKANAGSRRRRVDGRVTCRRRVQAEVAALGKAICRSSAHWTVLDARTCRRRRTARR